MIQEIIPPTSGIYGDLFFPGILKLAKYLLAGLIKK